MHNSYLMFFFCFLTTIQTFGQIKNNDRRYENLHAFARLYGYIKYFHPSDEAASINWDKFAIYGSQAVISAKTDDELILKLKELFSPIAPAVQIYKTNNKQKFDITTITPPDVEDYSPIAWQHLGVGLGNSDNIYKSIRINRPGVSQVGASSFAPINQLLDAAPYAGKQIRVKAWMKVLQYGAGGKGQLWLRVDKETGRGFFYNMDDRPATAAEWKEYEFIAPIDKDGKNIYFGAFLSGRGELIIDGFELFVKEENEWKPISIKNGSFEDIKDNAPTGWNAIGKVPLYLYSSNNTDTKNGKYSLKISSKTMDSVQGYANLDTSIFNKYPIIGEVTKKPLSKNIEAIIPLALYGNKVSTYPVSNQPNLIELKKNIDPGTKEKKDGNDLSVRIANVIIAWNVFKHFFPYWENAVQDPETIFKNAISKALTDQSALDFLETLRLMFAPLNDGHIRVSFGGDTNRNWTVPVLLDWVENKLVIDKVLDSGLNNKLKQGDVIVSINNVGSKEFMIKYEKALSGSGQWKRSLSKNELLNGIKNSTINIATQRNGKISNHALSRSISYRNIYNAGSKRPISGFIRKGIYYIDLTKLPFDSIINRLTELKDTRSIICDLRGYPKNNHQLISHFLKEKENTKWMFLPEIIYPDYEKVTYDGLGWNMVPEKEHLNAKVIFITDGRAISYAESYMGYIKDFKLATIIGQPTAGTNGNVNPFTLPGGYRISWTGMLVKNHDGSRHHLKGIIPDIYVERTIKGISEGRDELMEKAIELAEK